jgi:DNA-binding IscR family transcriptional regulator
MARQGIGFTVGAHRVADRMVCDSLVKSGHLTAVEGVDGGYRLSDEMVAANAITIERTAKQAELN